MHYPSIVYLFSLQFLSHIITVTSQMSHCNQIEQKTSSGSWVVASLGQALLAGEPGTITCGLWAALVEHRHVWLSLAGAGWGFPVNWTIQKLFIREQKLFSDAIQNTLVTVDKCYFVVPPMKIFQQSFWNFHAKFYININWKFILIKHGFLPPSRRV